MKVPWLKLAAWCCMAKIIKIGQSFTKLFKK